MTARPAGGGDPLESARRALLVGSVATLSAAAWLALSLWGEAGSPAGVLLHTHGFAHAAAGSVPTMALVIVGWMVMTFAMMLPTSLPVIVLFHTFAGRRPDRSLLVCLVIAGYVSIWAAFGVVVYVGQLLVSGVMNTGLVGDSAWREWGGPTILGLAGIYQFTPFKYRCLEKCRSPLSFVIEHWQGSNDRGQAVRLGVHHGLFCVGCCWALMLLMFVTGLGNLAWMFLLAAVMAVEKNVAWGRRLSAPIGVTLLVWGVVLAVG